MEVYEHGYHDFVLGNQGQQRDDLPRGEILLPGALDALELTIKFLKHRLPSAWFSSAAASRARLRSGRGRIPARPLVHQSLIAIERAVEFFLLTRDHVADLGHGAFQVREFLFDGVEAVGIARLRSGMGQSPFPGNVLT